MIVFARVGVKRDRFSGSNLPATRSFPGASKNRPRLRGRPRGVPSPAVKEIAYDPCMGVVRMAIDVAERGRQPAITPGDGVALLEIIPLAWGEQSLAFTAAVAASCGLRPEGFLAELTNRPGRRVRGLGAMVPCEKAPGSIAAEPGAQAGLAGVILLLESTPSDSVAPRFSIPWLLVRPESRRSGVGRALVAAALGTAEGLGASCVSIETLDRWPEALAFWREVGFR